MRDQRQPPQQRLDVTRVLDLPNLGSIGAAPRRALGTVGLITVTEPHSALAEAYRVLRSNVRFASSADPRCSSWSPAPASARRKTVTSANLAASFARAGERTILVDANLRTSPCTNSSASAPTAG